MQTAREEMRDFASQRNELLLELGSCMAAGAALWAIAGRLEGAPPELKALFVALLLSFTVGFVGFVSQLIPVLSFRCPRCAMRFHAAGDRLGLRSCAHCGFRAHGSDWPPS